MIIKTGVKSVILFALMTLSSCGSVNSQSSNNKVVKNSRPNIIVILCDDLGYADVGFNGSKDITTPELDKLAKSGTIFSSAYVTHPFCGPSRAGLLTGRYPHEYGSQFNLPVNSEKTVGKGIELSETFMSNVIQNAGYYTGIVGKWHLGAVPDYHPNKRGFDDFYGFLGGGHSYIPSDYMPKYEQQVAAGNKNIWEYLVPLEHNGVKVQETEYLTDGLSREAIRFVKEGAKKEAPFFLYLAYNAPHSPLEAKEEDLKKFENIKDKNRRVYAAMVYAVDRGVGKLVEALKETNQFDNTLIVFLSDNGGRTDEGANNAPLQGVKGDVFEGGFRVPMFFHWPNHVKAGMRYDFPVSSLDFYPTFSNLAKATIPKGKILEGKDIMKDVIAGTNTRKNEMIFAMRHRSGFSDVGVRMDQWKAVKAKNGSWKLFDIDKDISEKFDLSKQNPDQLKKMILGAKKWSENHSEPRWFDPENLRKIWSDTGMASFPGVFDSVD